MSARLSNGETSQPEVPFGADMYARAGEGFSVCRRRSGIRGVMAVKVDRRGGGGGGGGLLGISELVLFHRMGRAMGGESRRGAGRMSSSWDGLRGIRCRSSSSSGTVLVTLRVSKVRLFAECGGFM